MAMREPTRAPKGNSTPAIPPESRPGHKKGVPSEDRVHPGSPLSPPPGQQGQQRPHPPSNGEETLRWPRFRRPRLGAHRTDPAQPGPRARRRAGAPRDSVSGDCARAGNRQRTRDGGVLRACRRAPRHPVRTARTRHRIDPGCGRNLQHPASDRTMAECLPGLVGDNSRRPDAAMGVGGRGLDNLGMAGAT